MQHHHPALPQQRRRIIRIEERKWFLDQKVAPFFVVFSYN
jgi:hypothetical protein